MMIAADVLAQGVIDVHSHIITPELLSSLENEGRLMDEGFPVREGRATVIRKCNEAGARLGAGTPRPVSVLRRLAPARRGRRYRRGCLCPGHIEGRRYQVGNECRVANMISRNVLARYIRENAVKLFTNR